MSVDPALRLRQICLVAHDLEWTSSMLSAAFDAPVVFRDPRMAAGQLQPKAPEVLQPMAHALLKALLRDVDPELTRCGLERHQNDKIVAWVRRGRSAERFLAEGLGSLGGGLTDVLGHAALFV